MSLSPALIEALLDVQRRAHAAGHGGKEAVYAAACQHLGYSRATLMRRLKEVTVKPERKRRTDAGKTSLSLADAQRLTEHTKNLKRINAEAKAAGADDDPQLQAELRQRVAQETERYKKELNSLPNPALQNAKAAAELTAAQLQQNLQLLQASITSGDAIVTYALEKGQVTIEAAYQARLGMIQTENQAQREALAKERQEIEKELKLAVKPEERDAARKRVVEVETKAKLLDSSLAEATRKLSIWKTEQERSLATITAKVRVDVAGITGQFDRQAIQDQLKLQYQGDYEAAGRLNPEEAAAARERIDLLVAAGAAQAEFNAKLAEAQRLQQAQAAIEAAIQQRVSTGQISQIEGEAKIQQARAAQVPLLQAIVDGLERIKGAMPTDAAVAIDQMTTSIAEMRNTVASSTPVIVDWGTKAKNTAIDGLADAAANAVTQFSSLRDMVSGTLKNIAADLVRSDIKRLLMNLFKMDAGGGGGGGGAGSFIGAIWSGARSIFGFAEGGQIRGPGTGASDSVPALVDGRRPVALSNGEWIQPVKAVQHYGAPFMEAVRTLRLPKPSTGYALGGLVQASQRARFATGGAVAAAAAAGAGGAAPNVVFQMTNTGTPQRVVRQSSSFEGKDLVVRVLLADAAAGGPITQALGPALSRN